MVEERIRTIFDDVLDIIIQKGKISIKNLKKLFPNEKRIDYALKVWQKYGVIRISYPDNPLASPVIIYEG